MRVNFLTNNYQQSQNNKQKVAFEKMFINTTKKDIKVAARKTSTCYGLAREQIALFWDSLKLRETKEAASKIKTNVSLLGNGNMAATVAIEDSSAAVAPITIDSSIFSRYGRTKFFEKLDQAQAKLLGN